MSSCNDENSSNPFQVLSVYRDYRGRFNTLNIAQLLVSRLQSFEVLDLIDAFKGVWTFIKTCICKEQSMSYLCCQQLIAKEAMLL